MTAHFTEHADPMERRVQSPEHRASRERCVRPAPAATSRRSGSASSAASTATTSARIERGEINLTLKVLLALAKA